MKCNFNSKTSGSFLIPTLGPLVTTGGLGQPQCELVELDSVNVLYEVLSWLTLVEPFVGDNAGRSLDTP